MRERFVVDVKAPTSVPLVMVSDAIGIAVRDAARACRSPQPYCSLLVTNGDEPELKSFAERVAYQNGDRAESVVEFRRADRTFLSKDGAVVTPYQGILVMDAVNLPDAMWRELALDSPRVQRPATVFVLQSEAQLVLMRQAIPPDVRDRIGQRFGNAVTFPRLVLREQDRLQLVCYITDHMTCTANNGMGTTRTARLSWSTEAIELLATTDKIRTVRQLRDLTIATATRVLQEGRSSLTSKDVETTLRVSPVGRRSYSTMMQAVTPRAASDAAS